MEVTKNILVVEDEPPAQRQLKELLENQGYKVIVVSEEKSVFQTLIEHSELIDLILLDVILPDAEKNGVKIFQKIKEMEEKREIKTEIPVIFVTVKRETEVIKELAKSGAKYSYEGFFEKPLIREKIDDFLELTHNLSNKRSENVFFSVLKKHNIDTIKAKKIYNELFDKSFLENLNVSLDEDLYESHHTDEYLKRVYNLINLLSDTKKSFSDKIDRRLFFSDFKKELKEIWHNRETYNQYLAQVIDLLFCAIRFTKPEDLISVKQLDSFLLVARELTKLDMNRYDAKRCGKILREVGIRTLPQLGKD